MGEHSRDWWLHESEHVFVVVLLLVVLFQATQIAVQNSTSSPDPVVIIPGSNAFTVYGGQTVQYPWLLVNRLDTTVQVESDLILNWDGVQHNQSQKSRSVTALVVDPVYTAVSRLGPGDHKTYRYVFTAPKTPGQYRMTIAAKADGYHVQKDTVVMRVVSSKQ